MHRGRKQSQKHNMSLIKKIHDTKIKKKIKNKSEKQTNDSNINEYIKLTGP